MRADVGKELNLSVIGGAGDVVRLRLMDENEERIETAGKTFYAELRSMETDKRLASVGVTYSAERDVVLTLPEMGVGQYVLVVEVSASSGARERLVSGWVTYMEPGALVKPKVDASPDRLMGIIMDGERHRCVWYHTTHAEVQADRAEASAAGAEVSAAAAADSAEAAAASAERAAGIASGMQGALDNAVDLVTQRAESAAGRAENAAVRAESAKDVVVDKFEQTDAFIDAFWEEAYKVIKPDTQTGTWVIGSYNTGVAYCGENGKAPEINGVGEWLVYDWEKGWVNTGVMAKGQDGFSPNINSEGNWVWKDTHGEIHVGPSAYGKDGKDGSVVVRHLVGSFEDIPTEGETCNSGHIYYVPIASELTRREVSSFRAGDNTNVGNFRGEIIFAARRSASVVGAENTPAFGQEQTGRRLVRFGMLAGFSNGDEPSAEALYAHLYFRENGAWSYLGKSAEAVAQVSGVESFWEFEDLVLPIGAYDMRVVFSRYEERETAEQNKETVRVQVVDNPGDDSFCGENREHRWAAISSWVLESVYTKGYDVYHWVHKADGSEGWVPVNELYDLATAEVYGLMKYATDLPVQDGAPVGKNSSGQACVPKAELSVAGAGKLSDGDALNDRNSGLVGIDAHGAFRTSKASHERHGSVKFSREDTLARCLCIELKYNNTIFFCKEL